MRSPVKRKTEGSSPSLPAKLNEFTYSESPVILVGIIETDYEGSRLTTKVLGRKTPEDSHCK